MKAVTVGVLQQKKEKNGKKRFAGKKIDSELYNAVRFWKCEGISPTELPFLSVVSTYFQASGAR